MTKKRPLGVKLIAALFFLESVALLVAAVIGYMSPELRSNANEFIAQRAPFIQQIHLVQFGIELAPLFAFVDVVEGLGIWFLKRWARTFVLLDLLYRLGGGLVAALMLWTINRKMLSSITSTPHFIIGVVINILMLGYLLDPFAKRVFAVPDDQFA